MQKIVLTPAQVADVCNIVLTKSTADNSLYNYHYWALNAYGLRVSEVMQTERPYLDEYNRLHFHQPKVNRERIIYDVDEWELSIVQRIYDLNNLTYINVRGMQREFARYNPYRLLYCGDKQISTHIFRHNYAKQRMELYEDFDRVHLELGELTPEVTEHYINSEIYFLA